MQEAFHEHHGLQCGFCTPGMIMAGVGIVNRNGHDLDEHTIRDQLEGNICRCTGYHNIVKAIQAGAKAMSGKSVPRIGWRGARHPARREHPHRRARAAQGRLPPHHRRRDLQR